SELSHWPVQMHLLPPTAPHFRDADLLLAADCAGFACGDFHRSLLKGKRLAIACPKLDSQQEIYLDKLKALIDFGGIRSLTVVTMEVPCCRGLLQLARRAVAQAEREVPLYWKELSVEGRILQEGELKQPAGV
ncbi:MAG: 4Fe-4S ferredoxin, partial [Spirochaetales bacterium]|nr:4Fe-4S ferredoxin [Spirochaetales bacterium]